MAEGKRVVCPECGEEGVSRRDFLKVVGATAATAAVGGLAALTPAGPAAAQSAKLPKAESLVKVLYEGLSEAQRKVICAAWDDPRRTRISANWAITEPKIGSEFYTTEQRELIRGIFRGVTSEEGYDKFLKQMDGDWGGFNNYHIAIFGEPGSGKFEWEMTGRHLTIRADGDSVEDAAFGGPIVYGHGAGDSQPGLPGNVFYAQTLRANEVFKALDGKQREKALLEKAPPETAVKLQGANAAFPGIAVGELSKDQKGLVEAVMKDILSPYRKSDVQEALTCLKKNGGLDKLHIAFYKQDDIGSDNIWDIWRLEGPAFVWHFRGAPHVHTYINIAHKAQA